MKKLTDEQRRTIVRAREGLEEQIEQWILDVQWDLEMQLGLSAEAIEWAWDNA